MPSQRNVLALNFVLNHLFVALHRVFPNESKMLACVSEVISCGNQFLSARKIADHVYMGHLAELRMQICEKASTNSAEMSSNPDIWKWYSYTERVVENIGREVFYDISTSMFDVESVYTA